MLLNTMMSKARLQINVWRKVSQQRSDIRKLSNHLLDDIGLTRFHADIEVLTVRFGIFEKAVNHHTENLRIQRELFNLEHAHI